MKITIEKPVSVLRGEKPTRFPYCNCLLIEDQTRALIETGTELPVLAESGPESVEVVLNSHAHLDHMHGNWAFPRARIGFHPAEAPLAQSGEAFARNFVLGLWPRFMNVPLNLKLQFDRPQEYLAFQDTRLVHFPASRVDFTFDDGDELDFGQVKLQVLHTPGHCRGHCCFYWEREGILFSSDIDFTSGGPWYGNESADLDEFIASVRRIVEIAPRITIPAHGRVISGGLEQLAQSYLDHIHRRDESILSLLSRPSTLQQLSEQRLIYPERLHPIFEFWEKVMVYKHLTRLIKLGEVRQQGDTYFRSPG